jgi:hypothetical protein
MKNIHQENKELREKYKEFEAFFNEKKNYVEMAESSNMDFLQMRINELNEEVEKYKKLSEK